MIQRAGDPYPVPDGRAKRRRRVDEREPLPLCRDERQRITARRKRAVGGRNAIGGNHDEPAHGESCSDTGPHDSHSQARNVME